MSHCCNNCCHQWYHCSNCARLQNNQCPQQASVVPQIIDETVVIKDSCDVTVCITDKQQAFSLQAALQSAIVLILQVYTGDDEKSIRISQELFQATKVEQVNKQKFIVEHSKNVYIESSDVQSTVNIQILVQLLISLVEKINIG